MQCSKCFPHGDVEVRDTKNQTNGQRGNYEADVEEQSTHVRFVSPVRTVPVSHNLQNIVRSPAFPVPQSTRATHSPLDRIRLGGSAWIGVKLCMVGPLPASGAIDPYIGHRGQPVGLRFRRPGPVTTCGEPCCRPITGDLDHGSVQWLLTPRPNGLNLHKLWGYTT
jgi:hypothetical protein